MAHPTESASNERVSQDHEKDEEKGYGDSRSPSVSPAQSTFPSAANKAQEPAAQQKLDDWDGPDDKDNPQNFSRARKILYSFIPSANAFTATLASSIYTPGRESVMQDFGVSAEVALLPYVLYVLGLAFGPMIAAPASETVGRRYVYLVCVPIFALFILGSGFSTNIASLCICRFFAGVFGSPGTTIGSATLSDMWLPHERAVPMAVYITTPFLAPSLGPLIGGFATEAYGWRWTEWIILFFVVVGLTPCLAMTETYKKVILRRRAKARGVPTHEPERTVWQATKFFLGSTLTRPLHMAMVEPVVGLFTAYIGINFSLQYSFFAAFPWVFQTKYGFGLGSIGLTFLGLGVGSLVGFVIIVVYSRLVFRRQVQRSKEEGHGGKVKPESRLVLAMIGSICLPISLFLFAWTAENHVHWIVPVIAEGIFGCGNGLVFNSAVLYLMDFYGPLHGASAMGGNNLVRYMLGAAFPLFVVQMYERLGTGWATSLLAFIELALTPIPWAFYVWGPRLREKSRYQKGT